MPTTYYFNPNSRDTTKQCPYCLCVAAQVVPTYSKDEEGKYEPDGMRYIPCACDRIKCTNARCRFIVWDEHTRACPACKQSLEWTETEKLWRCPDDL
jgi:hypothetical protein